MTSLAEYCKQESPTEAALQIYKAGLAHLTKDELAIGIKEAVKNTSYIPKVNEILEGLRIARERAGAYGHSPAEHNETAITANEPQRQRIAQMISEVGKKIDTAKIFSHRKVDMHPSAAWSPEEIKEFMETPRPTGVEERWTAEDGWQPKSISWSLEERRNQVLSAERYIPMVGNQTLTDWAQDQDLRDTLPRTKQEILLIKTVQNYGKPKRKQRQPGQEG